MKILVYISCLFLSLNVLAQSRDTLYINSSKKLVFKNGDKKAYIEVDGIAYNDRLETIDTGNISSVDVFKPKDAVTLYGAKAENGAILIKTKNAQKPDSTQTFGMRCLPSTTEAKALIVIDDKITAIDISAIPNVDQIIDVAILKGVNATDKYGTSAKDGVIIITTKPYAISKYQGKFSIISKDYKKLVKLNQNNDLGFLYVINGMPVQGKQNDIINKLYNLPAIDVKTVDCLTNFQGAETKQPIIAITTKK